MNDARPFLRTPPFPHTDPRRTAIAVPGDAVVDDPERGERLLDLIASARVGGAFWAGAWDAVPDRAHGDDEEVAIAAILRRPIAVTTPGRYGTPETGPDRAAVARHLLTLRCRDPFTGAAIAPEAAVAILAAWRDIIEANRGITVAMGMAWWKRRQIGTFLWRGATGSPPFVRSDAAAVRRARREGGAIAVWPSRVSPRLLARAGAAGVPIVRVEDGFIRSVGLGSALHPPFSITVDPLGIHYDPRRPSALETLLETAPMPDALVARAAVLRETIVARGISKYGGGTGPALPPRTPGRRRVLVTGQVSDDLSVLAGGDGIAGNADLLARARAAEPNAEIWFRPHPDVDAGHRAGAIADADALRHADRVVRGGGMAELLAVVDGVHVLTSLSGFEALLRGCDVTTHGTPFYAGWGLTRDLGTATGRRTRRLSLDQLVAGVLILFPRYLDPDTGLPCPVEMLVARLGAQAAPRLGLLHRLRAIQGRFTRRRR